MNSRCGVACGQPVVTFGVGPSLPVLVLSREGIVFSKKSQNGVRQI